MSYADQLREHFLGLEPRLEDLFALEAHQIAELPTRAPAREFADVLHAHPEVRTFLVARRPPIAGYLTELLARHPPRATRDLEVSGLRLLWEIADWIVYDTVPELYDGSALHDWDFAAVTDIVAVEDMTVIDAGAGSGKVAFEAVRSARHVFAVEPVARLREFMRSKASDSGITKLFVLDGTLDAIPLPPGSADVLVTCRAIGWRLEEELMEIERVVRGGGVALHLGLPDPSDENAVFHERLMAAGYAVDTYADGPTRHGRYRKRL